MKYADGPTVEVQTLIDAPAAAVWALVCDISTPTRFSEELQEVQWVDEQRFVGRSHHPAIGNWEATCTVVAREPERLFGWAVGDPTYPSAEWRFTLEPVDTGILLRQWMRMGPARSGLSMAIDARPDKEERIVARRLDEHRANMQTTVEGIKQVAEAQQSAPAD